VALVDIGFTKSSINILRNNVTYFAREVPMGGQDLTNAITRRFGLETYEAEALKRDPQEQVGELQDAVSPVLDDLGNEINLSFDFFENQFDGEVEEVYLSGGSVLLPFLEESLEKIFDKRTRVWNPIEGLKVKSDNVDIDALNQSAPQLAVAVGLAATST
jgi:type IV pilus assembly protein PilM